MTDKQTINAYIEDVVFKYNELRDALYVLNHSTEGLKDSEDIFNIDIIELEDFYSESLAGDIEDLREELNRFNDDMSSRYKTYRVNPKSHYANSPFFWNVYDKAMELDMDVNYSENKDKEGNYQLKNFIIDGTIEQFEELFSEFPDLKGYCREMKEK